MNTEEFKCAICGKPAKYISHKFISPLCEECAKKETERISKERNEQFAELEDYYTEPCEEMNNIEKIFESEYSVG